MKEKIKKDYSSKTKIYEKPKIKLEPEMNFMFQAIKKLPTKTACRQCSSCHACR